VLWGPEVRDVSDTLETLVFVGILLIDEINLLIGNKDVEATSLIVSRRYLELRHIDPAENSNA
jgi:hypothetical protein